MNEARKIFGFIQLFLVVCLANNGNFQEPFVMTDLDIDQNVCDKLSTADAAVSIFEAIPYFGAIITGAKKLVDWGVNSMSLDTSCDDIPFERLKRAMIERFDKLDEKVDRNYFAIKQLDSEIRRLFGELSDELKDSRIHIELSELKTFIEGFRKYQSSFDGYLKNENFVAIIPMLKILTDATNPTGGQLTTRVHNIINLNYATPEDGHDESEVLALYALYYGVQTYVSVMLFLLDKHSLVAKYYYGKGDVEKYNDELLAMQVVFNDLKSLSSTNGRNRPDNNALFFNSGTTSTVNGLINRFLYTAQLAKRKIDLQRRDSDKPITDSIREKIEAMDKTNKKIAEMVPPMIEGKPNKLDKITIPVGEGTLRIADPSRIRREQLFVKYTIQYKHQELYSIFSDWSEEYTLGETGFASIKLPRLMDATDRVVFRKLSSDQHPEMVGIIDNPSQTVFIDIHRDLYNAASLASVGANQIISRLIKNGADVNAIFEKGRTPLHAAAEANNVDAAKILLQNGNISIQDHNGYTPLHVAAAFGSNDVCELLISKRDDINKRTYGEGLTPLHIAAINGRDSTVKLLMKTPGIDINLTDKNGETALHCAVSNKHPNVVLTLISNQQINLKVLSNKKLSPLHQAVMDNSPDIVEMLAKRDLTYADLGGPDEFRAIHFAVLGGHKHLISILVNNHGDYNAQSNEGWTPLHYAVMIRENDVLLDLLRFKCTKQPCPPFRVDLTVATVEGYTPLHMAVSSGQYYVIEDLTKAGMNLEAKTNEGLTPLHVAAMHNYANVVDMLIIRGANKEARTMKGQTFWELAVEKGALDVVKEYLPNGLSNEVQHHLLNAATENGHLEVLKYLIEEKRYTRREPDLMLIYKSIENNHTKISKYLIDFLLGNMAYVDVGLLKTYFIKYFVTAARMGNLDLMKYLVNHPSWNENAFDRIQKFVSSYDSYVDKDGVRRIHTALHEAVYTGNKQIIDYLMENSVDITTPDEYGNKAVDIAKENEYWDVYGMLKITPICNLINFKMWVHDRDLDRNFINERCYDYLEKIFSCPLNIAITYEDDISYRLINLGAGVHCLDDNRNTPLHLAIAHKKDILTNKILDKNPDVRIKNKKKQKPIDVAKEVYASPNIIERLKSMESAQKKRDGFPN